MFEFDNMSGLVAILAVLLGPKGLAPSECRLWLHLQ